MRVKHCTIITPEWNSSLDAGSEFWVDIIAANIDSLFGISFVVETNGSEYIQPVTANAGKYLGDDVLFYYNIDEPDNSVSVGITKIRSQQNASGAGILTIVKLIKEVEIGTEISIHLTDIIGE